MPAKGVTCPGTRNTRLVFLLTLCYRSCILSQLVIPFDDPSSFVLALKTGYTMVAR